MRRGGISIQLNEGILFNFNRKDHNGLDDVDILFQTLNVMPKSNKAK